MERHRCLVWQQTALILLNEIEDSSSSSSSSFSSNCSMNSDSDDDEELDDDDEMELLDEFLLAFSNANAIALDLNQIIEHPTINWRWKDGLTVQQLSADDALTHFRFRKVHLQEVSDKLWPRLSAYLVGTKEKIVFGDGHYSAPYETLLLLVLFDLLDHVEFAATWKNSSDFEEIKFASASKQWCVLCTPLRCSTLTIQHCFITLRPVTLTSSMQTCSPGCHALPMRSLKR